MSNPSSGEETSSKVSVTEKEWLGWFEKFKDERGEWVQDHRLLKGLRFAFGKEKKEKISEPTDSEEEEVNEEVSDEECPKNEFLEKLLEFTDTAKDYLKSRTSTFTDFDRPYRPSKPNYWFYKEFRDYLEKHKFIDKMVAVLVKMFALHPNLPEKPLEYIRDNFGISKKEEDDLVTEWMKVTTEMVELQEEATVLEERIQKHKAEPEIESEETLSGMGRSPRSTFPAIIGKKKDETPEEAKLPDQQELSAEEEGMPFSWEDSASSSFWSFNSSESIPDVESQVITPYPDQGEEEEAVNLEGATTTSATAATTTTTSESSMGNAGEFLSSLEIDLFKELDKE